MGLEQADPPGQGCPYLTSSLLPILKAPLQALSSPGHGFLYNPPCVAFPQPALLLQGRGQG